MDRTTPVPGNEEIELMQVAYTGERVAEAKLNSEGERPPLFDVIVELAGRRIESIYDYTYALNAVKVGQSVEIVVERDGQQTSLAVTPGSRE